jgi:DNA-binding transcriptional LysR family regulator
VALLPVAIARRYADLVQIALPLSPPSRTPWLVVHRDLKRQASVRLVHQWVLEVFNLLLSGGASN